MKVVYIRSLSRSGSTYLQHLMTHQYRCVGVGESARAIRNASSEDGRDVVDKTRLMIGDIKNILSDSPCSCGLIRSECTFWGPLLSQFKPMQTENNYKLFVSRCQTLFPDYFVVDNSKIEMGYYNLIKLAKLRPEEIKVIALVRDFRGWVLSSKKHSKVCNRLRGIRSFARGYIADSYRWLSATRKMVNSLNKIDSSSLLVSYEQLIFNQRNTINHIASFIGADEVDSAAGEQIQSYGQCHELFGSQSMRSTKQLVMPTYDGSWVSDSSSYWYAPLLAPVLYYNAFLHRSIEGTLKMASQPEHTVKYQCNLRVG